MVLAIGPKSTPGKYGGAVLQGLTCACLLSGPSMHTSTHTRAQLTCARRIAAEVAVDCR
jgi:hypothetical protein